MQNPFEHIQKILAQCGENVARRHGNKITIEHLILEFVQKNKEINYILETGFRVDINVLENSLNQEIAKAPNSNSEESEQGVPSLDATASELMRNAIKEAYICDNSPYVEPKHVLLALLKQNNSSISSLLSDNGITYDSLREYLKSLNRKADDEAEHQTEEIAEAEDAEMETDEITEADIEETHDESDLAVQENNENDETEPEEDMEQISKRPKANLLDSDDEPLDLNTNPEDNKKTAKKEGKKAKTNTPFIDKYGHDLTQDAAKGILDPMVGRENEVQRVMEILGRRKKNNPVLIGEPGVGKSAIVEGLAQLIKNHQSAPLLFDKRVISLDLTGLVAGTKYRGSFEERIKGIVNELETHPEIILFIDEIHTLIGAGGAEGAMDAANILKPALARGVIQCIGATTLDEYRKSIEKDGALERRFQKIIINPTTPEETLRILHNIKNTYEKFHEVTYSDEALEACVKLTDRYVTDRFFPDKAIDILDEVGSRVHLKNASIPDDILELEHNIEVLITNKQNAVANQNYELAAAYRDQQAQMEKMLTRAREKWQNGESDSHRTPVEVDDITAVVSKMTGVPVQRMAEAENSRLLKMAEKLKSKVIAQDNAVDKIVKAIQRNRIGLRDPNHPIGVFMFLGPTGVGKTYLAKKLAEEVYGDSSALIRIDMSEYADEFNSSRLVGAPPGYVGYNEGGQLTEKVRRKPYSIVLLDEIEKASGKIFNMLLQVLDEGRLTDGNGRLIDFRNTIIIMTSNAGTRQLKEFGKGVGFKSGSIGNVATMSDTDKEYARNVIQKSLSKQFAPEFLNRLDEIITFDQLDINAIKRIIDLELSSLIKRINDMGYGFQITEKAKQLVAEKGYDVQFGARPLKRAIQTYIEDGVCELLMQGKLEKGSIINVGKCPGKDELTFK